MKTKLFFLATIFLLHKGHAQTLRQYIPTIAFTFLTGASDGLRDAAMYRMDHYGNFWNGKQSWLNKYKNRDITKGPAYWGSTSVLVFTTDGSHLSNLVTHQFEGMAIAYAPADNNRKLGHVFLKVLAYNAIRQISHSLIYEVVFKPQGRD